MRLLSDGGHSTLTGCLGQLQRVRGRGHAVSSGCVQDPESSPVSYAAPRQLPLLPELEKTGVYLVGLHQAHGNQRPALQKGYFLASH